MENEVLSAEIKTLQRLHPLLKKTILIQVMSNDYLVKQISQLTGDTEEYIYAKTTNKAIDRINKVSDEGIKEAIDLMDEDLKDKNPWLFDEETNTLQRKA